jgi:hypothetical protein
MRPVQMSAVGKQMFSDLIWGAHGGEVQSTLRQAFEEASRLPHRQHDKWVDVFKLFTAHKFSGQINAA